ncbi:hypothetical protein C3747_1g337 [Trypanosoma cruzi]|uniref:Protein FAM184A/B N-terminal domain-containing protein n=2 Tax=Trypanosoma cruzi TaxID=5693 RepID=Q4DWX6_TRYCC|nr:hypothetical protein, conserved [Trypanosoma cruzi]EAN97020.1 hypothetical protein, conserved [Trypanosoma cruzi]PWV22158.1 hypothetical protein C3747_1g337 [Trypanosoma cruzi]RNC49702.1 protein FAM184A [Trypanosoma cruzi]|eukprot:XP_818871.1 hypothetical protein [Trypanosoma cruzi strain CL Brener]
MNRRHSGGGDTHYKMCKKIAQLTKVIYQLNTQNEDYDERNAEMRRRHEEELRTICSEAERRVEGLRKAFREEEEKRNGAVEAMKRGYMAELQEAKDAYARKSASMVDELSASKKKFEEVIAEVRGKALEEAAKKSAANEAETVALCAAKDEETARLRASKEQEISNLVREYNERYKAMLAEQMDARDALEEKLNLLQSQLDAATAAHAEELQKWEQKLHDSNDVATSMSAELSRWKEDCRCREAEVSRLQQECDTLHRRLDAESNSLGVSRDVEATLRQDAELLRTHLKEVQEGRDKLERALSEKTTGLTKASADITDLENQKSLLETQQGRLLHDLNDAKKENQQLLSRVEALDRRVLELEEAKKAAEQEIGRRSRAERLLEERCDELGQNASELVKKHQEEINALQAKHENALFDIHLASQKSNDVFVTQLRREKEELISHHTQELRRQKEQHDQQIEKLTREHEKVLLDLRGQLSSADSVGGDLRVTIAQLRETVVKLEEELNTAKNEIQVLVTQKNELAAKCEAMRGDHARRIAEMEARMNAEREVQIGKRDALEAEIASLRNKLQADAEASERNWESKIRAQAEGYESRLRQICEEHNNRLRHLTELNNSANAQLEARHQEQIRNLMEAAKLQKEAERKESNIERKEFAKQLQRGEEELQRAKDQMDAMRQSAKEHATRFYDEIQSQRQYIEKFTADYELLREELQKSNVELNGLREEYAQLEKEMRLWKGRECDARQALERLEEASSRSMKEVEALHRDYVSSMEEKFSQKTQAALAELRATLTAERDAVQLRADGVIAAARQKCADLQEEVKSLNLKLDASVHDIRKRTEELEREKSRKEAVHREFTATLEAMRRDFEDEKESQRRDTENQLKEISTNHKTIIDDLMEQHDEERTTQNNVIRKLQAALDELRYRYEYRESREEDVAMINRLMREIKQKDQALEKTIRDMKMYKMELINREENYNKVFGRRPLVEPGPPADKAPRLLQGMRENRDRTERRATQQ